MRQRYGIKEIFRTVQGEGFHAGRSAVFVRFTGCNAWSGYSEHRARDSARLGAICALWCDTDFRKGDMLTVDEIEARVLWECDRLDGAPLPMVVFTGGEPLLQLDAELARRLKEAGLYLALETNGSVRLEQDLGRVLDWVCVSPKWGGERWVQTQGDELKLVVPNSDPLLRPVGPMGVGERMAGRFGHFWLQPCDLGFGPKVHDANTRFALEQIKRDPRWRLSVQTHKAIGVP
jgi:7-carboxy-7-deazaguanine synthase